MKVNKKILNTGEAIERLNEAVTGMDPVNGVLTRLYNNTSPLQDRVDVLEQTAAGLLVTKYIGPETIVALGVPQALSGQAAIDLLDAMVFAQNHPNDKKAIGLIADVPEVLINDPVNFPNNTNIAYTLTLTVFAAQEDSSGHTKMLLQGDSPEYKFEISCTINFNAESYVAAPTLLVRAISIKADHVLTNGGTLDVELLNLQNNKANKVVGGVYDGMDLKAAAEKLDSDKEDKITDTGWQELSLLNGWVNHGETNTLKIRRYGDVVNIKGRINGASATDQRVCSIPIGYRSADFVEAIITNSLHQPIYLQSQSNNFNIPISQSNLSSVFINVVYII